MSETAHKVRVTRPIREFMSGGQVWQDLQDRDESDAGDEFSVSLHRKIMTSTRKDRSVTVELNLEEAQTLWIYAGAQASGAADNVGNEPEALGELNASRALMRKLEDLFGREVTR